MQEVISVHFGGESKKPLVITNILFCSHNDIDYKALLYGIGIYACGMALILFSSAPGTIGDYWLMNVHVVYRYNIICDIEIIFLDYVHECSLASYWRKVLAPFTIYMFTWNIIDYCNMKSTWAQVLKSYPEIIVHEPGGLLVSFWVASSPIHFLKAQNLYFMKKSGGHVNKVA